MSLHTHGLQGPKKGKLPPSRVGRALTITNLKARLAKRRAALARKK